jgi:hypothetical protein
VELGRRRVHQVGEVAGGGVDTRRVGQRRVEIVADDPDRAAGEMAGEPADPLLLEHRGLLPGAPHRVVGDCIDHDARSREEELPHVQIIGHG